MIGNTFYNGAYNVKEFIAGAKALSDESRVRALLALKNGELCVCQIIELLGLAPSTVSKHMSILKQAGLVESRKEDRWIYYRLPNSTNSDSIALKMVRLSLDALSDSLIVRKDVSTLSKILKMDPEIICKKQRV